MNIKGMSEKNTFDDWQYLGAQADEFHTVTNLFFILLVQNAYEQIMKQGGLTATTVKRLAPLEHCNKSSRLPTIEDLIKH
jgi:hypothetical protein